MKILAVLIHCQINFGNKTSFNIHGIECVELKIILILFIIEAIRAKVGESTNQSNPLVSGNGSCLDLATRQNVKNAPLKPSICRSARSNTFDVSTEHVRTRAPAYAWTTVGPNGKDSSVERRHGWSRGQEAPGTSDDLSLHCGRRITHSKENFLGWETGVLAKLTETRPVKSLSPQLSFTWTNLFNGLMKTAFLFFRQICGRFWQRGELRYQRLLSLIKFYS